MECLFGIAGPDYCILAADTVLARSIVVMKGEEDNKFRQLTPSAVMAFSGEPGDAVNYAEFVQRNLVLNTVKNEGVEVGVDGAAAYSRKVLADALRSRTPYSVNVLIGGIADGRGQLYWMDYLASMVKVPFAAHGYGAYFCMGLLDRLYREGMDVSEGLELLHKCLLELKARFIVNLPKFAVRIVRSDGSVEETVLQV